ncbi:MAG: hypothetical protein AVDCRST_MAG87-1348 [uncultured Thermomicrobiales bacterium]|uniref:Glycosyltransferase RgtA/B/C/D-like domain-containing protein n=1 Tax=uncultured Thermomicrobiales bacterium TaxID=1645740 RepID=A0A6J4UQZ2_9BACT|nr:MAG: hypothetical protein AVDCRST_MAG87-1348 [uncultured Thermomicrobiales bacterium]
MRAPRSLAENVRAPKEDRVFLAACVAVTLLALMLRAVTLERAWVQIDEPSSLLAIRMVAEKGYPLFPSDVLYLQGALFSYLAAPLAWMLDGDALLDAAQALGLALGLIVVPVAMVLVRYLTASTVAAGLTGLLIAGDPNLIAWGITLRPYGLLAGITMMVSYCFVKLVAEGKDATVARVRAVTWIPVMAVLGTFTHIGFWLVAPAMALIGLVVWNRSLLAHNRLILSRGLSSLAAPLAFLLLGRYTGIGNGTGGVTTGASFVGSHLFSLSRVAERPAIRWEIWSNNFGHGLFHASLPLLIALCSGILIFRALAPAGDDARSTAGVIVVLIHWITILIVGVFVVHDPQPRYLVHILPLGYVMLSVAAASLWQAAKAHVWLPRLSIRLALAAIVVLPSLAHSASAAGWRMGVAGHDADYWDITRWVGNHYEAGQYVITALPPAAAFWFPQEVVEEQMFFLAGPKGRNRTERYSRKMEDGRKGDYWLGTPPIDSIDALCQVLDAHAGNAWIIVDSARLEAQWAYKGEMADVINGSSAIRHQGDGRSLALSVKPVWRWDRDLTRACTGE